MVFFNKIEQEVLSGNKRVALLKPTIQRELDEMKSRSSEHNVAGEVFKDFFVTWGYADKNNAITKEDLEKILEIIG